MRARNRVGIWLLYRPARLHRLAESIPWNRFLGSIKVKKYRLCTVDVGGTNELQTQDGRLRSSGQQCSPCQPN